jgi:hypothetical protein
LGGILKVFLIWERPPTKLNIKNGFSSMKYKLTKSYCWFEVESMKRVVKMYFINNVPFTWDDLTDDEEDNIAYFEAWANDYGRIFDNEYMFRASGYLVMEECHPCFFEMELENEELLAELD